VIDDGTSDPALDLCLKSIYNDSRLRMLRSKAADDRQCGLNVGLSAARGDFVGLCRSARRLGA